MFTRYVPVFRVSAMRELWHFSCASLIHLRVANSDMNVCEQLTLGREKGLSPEFDWGDEERQSARCFEAEMAAGLSSKLQGGIIGMGHGGRDQEDYKSRI